MTAKEEIFIKMILSAWQNGLQGMNKTLSVLSDEDLNLEVAPGRNKGAWLVGHLAAVNDSLFTILELGEKVNEMYFGYFLQGDVGIESPSASEIRKYWEDTSTQLNKKIAEFTTNDWFQRHSLVSSEDFAKEPHRNKLNVLITRTSHLNYHHGQLALLKKRK